MIKKLLKSLIHQELSSNEVPIFILKGFSVNIIVELFKELNLQRKLPFNSGKILISEINRDILNTFQSIMLSQSFDILLYEEACKISGLRMLGRKVILIDSQFSSFYPYEGNIAPVDTEKELFSLNNKNDLADFYSEIIVEKGTVKVSHLDIQDALEDQLENMLKVIGLSSRKQFHVERVLQKDLSSNVLSFGANGSNANTILENLFFNHNIPNDLSIAADSAVYLDPIKLNEAEKINGIFSKLDIGINWFEIQNEKNVEIQDDVLNTFKKHWGEQASFREISIYKSPENSNEIEEVSQGEIVQQIIRQSENAYQCNTEDVRIPYSDIFLTAPTGAGKSLLFQVPAFYLSENYGLVTIIISPLIALMKDQVNAIKNNRKFSKVAYINSELSLTDREEIINDTHSGEIDVLYLSPELFLSYSLEYFINERKLGLLVVDEAHLVTTWGRDFRVDYWFLGNHLNKLRKYIQDFPILTVTATAVFGGDNDMVYDTIDSLYLNDTIKYIGKVTRDNIGFNIQAMEIKGQGFKKQKIKKTAEFVTKAVENGKKTLIYCPYSSQVEEIYDELEHTVKMKVCKYYGSMQADMKQDSYLNYLHNNLKVMISTKAFGMGVDIPDIEDIYHHAPSGNLADYVQEVGRAARNPDLKGCAKIDFASKDLSFTKVLYGLSSIKPWELSEIMRKIYSIYEIKKSQNFLIDINQFQHIYPGDLQLDNKIKSGVMMIEKDLLQKYGFNVLIGRPKNLFAHVYARIGKEEYDRFYDMFKHYFTYIKDKNIEEKGAKVVCIRLDELWIDKYSHFSFPYMKALFFKGQLFTEFMTISPQQELEIELKNSYSSTLPFLQRGLMAIKLSFDNLRNQKAQFSQKDFEAIVINYLKDKTKLEDENYIRSLVSQVQKISVLIFKMYVAGKDNSFLQRVDKKEDGNSMYRIISSGYQKTFSEMIRRFGNHFGSLETFNKRKYYLATQKTFNEGVYVMAYFLEALELGTYITSGGKVPVMFVRLNDPRKFKKLVYSNYSNSLLENVYKRHLIAMSLFKYFFNSNLSNSHRWNFIEDYFLGEDIQEMIQKYCKISGHNYLDYMDEINRTAQALNLQNH